jgi:peptidyl-tRNA hydrolase
MGESFSSSSLQGVRGGADGRQPKIALKCKDTEELEILAAKARSLNLCARTIQDA